MIDLHQLRIFVAVSREGSLTRAADVVCLSHSAVSGQIKALEESLGLTLFERESRGMRLTVAGRVLLEEARLALDAANKVASKAQYLKNGVHGDCQVGTVSDPALLRLGEFMTCLFGRHPGLRLSFSQGISGEIVDRVLRGSLDAGYVIGTVDDPHLETVTIAPITLKIVGPVNWAEKLRNADWETLATFPWLSTPEKCSFHRLTRQLIARAGVTPMTVIEADQESTLRGLVAAGMGLSLMREEVAATAVAQGEAFIWNGDQERTQLWFIYPKAMKSDPKVIAMLEAVQEISISPSSPPPGGSR